MIKKLFILLIVIVLMVLVFLNIKNNTIKKITLQASQKNQSISNEISNASNNLSIIIPPFGTFVSNHYPGQNGSNFDEVSQCLTNPGAICEIFLTQDSKKLSLGSKKTDSQGSAYWNWNVKNLKLSSGEWNIRATANLKNKTITTEDKLKIEVQ